MISLNHNLIYGMIILCLIISPPLRPLLETSLINHMLIQIPLLVIAGVFLAKGFPLSFHVRYSSIEPYGIVSLLVAIFTIAYWLLPRNLDLAVLDIAARWLKQITLPMLAGIPLGLGGSKLPSLLCRLLWAMFTAMLFVMAWLYYVSPARLCNSYLIEEQRLLGIILLMIGMFSLFMFFIKTIGGLSIIQRE